MLYQPRAVLVAGLLALALGVAPAIAGKGGNGNGNGAAHGNAGSSTASSSISLDQTGPVGLGDSVTFSTTAVGLTGGEHAMVYLECTSQANGSLLFGQLDTPATTFVLGGGSSEWWRVGGAANCVAHLFAYGGKSIRELAEPYAFSATG